MNLKTSLPVFGFLLVFSTAISFLGYHYLSLASEYRERNTIHLSETQALLDVIADRPTLHEHEIEGARIHLYAAREQAVWCIENLSATEVKLFDWMGAAGALEICRNEIELTSRVDALLDQIAAPATATTTGPRSKYAQLRTLTLLVEMMRKHSRDFLPYTSIISNKVNGMVSIGTMVVAFALCIIFAIFAAEVLRSAEIQSQQTKSLRELATISEHANDSIVLTDAEGCITWSNPAFQELSGFTNEEIVGQKPGAFLQGPDTDPGAVQRIRLALLQRLPIKLDIMNYTKAGKTYWINLSISPLIDDKGACFGYAAISNDISTAMRQRAELEEANVRTERQANHDPLTGLPNRRYIDTVLETSVTNTDAPRTLVRVDLDHFKNINDTLGHAAGDHVLREVAHILTDITRPDDLVARVGGDEFVILMQQGTSQQAAFVLTERLRAKIREEMTFEDKTCRIGASFGISSAIGGLVMNEGLLKSADAALYVAKETGRNITTLYTPQIHADVQEKRMLSSEIEQGLARGEFEAFFHPQFQAETEVLIGLEALARWRHPTRGLLLPQHFLPVAEQLRLVSDIDKQVFGYGLDCVAEMNAEELFVPRVAFNVGAAQLMNPDLPTLMRERDIGFTRVSLEILESVMIENEDNKFMEKINDLRALDLGIEIDDFGSGHASVVALQRLNPDIMKLDGWLVEPVVQSETARKLVKSMIDMGKTLGIDVLAEGVETAEHAAILRDLGCDAYQGYYFGEPMPFEELEAFARTGFDPDLRKVTALSVHRDRRARR